jgi:hypothetical protein
MVCFVLITPAYHFRADHLACVSIRVALFLFILERVLISMIAIERERWV